MSAIDDCLICCSRSSSEPVVEADLDPAANNLSQTEILCLERLFGLSSDLTLPQGDDSRRVVVGNDDISMLLPVLHSAKYCQSCVRFVRHVVNLFANLEEIEQKLIETRNLVEKRLEQSLEEEKSKSLGIFPDDGDGAQSNQSVREGIILHLKAHRKPFTQWTVQRTCESLLNSSPTIRQDSLRGNINRNPSDNCNLIESSFSQIDGLNAPPSPARSFASNHSFEEKIFITDGGFESSEASIKVRPSKAHHQQRPTAKLIKIRKSSTEASTDRNQPSQRIRCPFTSDCTKFINRDTEINREAHWRRHHLGQRSCYVCKGCGKKFTGSSNLVNHMQLFHQIIPEIECTVGIHSTETFQELEEQIGTLTSSTFGDLQQNDSKLTQNKCEAAGDLSQLSSVSQSDRLNAPLSPARSFASSHSFEEKFMTDVAFESGQSSGTLGKVKPRKAHHLHQPTTKSAKIRKPSALEAKNVKRDHSQRIRCPFTTDCTKFINRDTEINRDAHWRRHHLGERSCYVCKVCGIKYTGSTNLINHLQISHQIIPETQTECSVAVGAGEIREMRQEAEEQKQIAIATFSMKRLKNDEDDDQHRTETSESGPCEIREKSKNDKRRQMFESSVRRGRGTVAKAGLLNIDPTSLSSETKNRKADVRRRKRLKCPRKGCRMSFRITEDHKRQAHVRKIHEGLSKCFRCDSCGIFFRSLYQWQRHSQKHTGIPVFVCKYCQLDCKTPDLRSKHVRLTHETEKIKHKCTEPGCGKLFLHRNAYDYHMQSHRKERPFICEICGATFTNNLILGYHQTKHLEIKTKYQPFKCQECGKQLASPSTLRIHIMKRHTKVYKLKCDQCDYGAHSQSELNKHVRSRHTDERVAKCPLCPATYKVQSALNVHMRKHTGERPYKCKTCGKDFIEGGALNRHELIHSGAQTHVCEICGKSFPLRNYLYIHLRSHNKNRPAPKTVVVAGGEDRMTQNVGQSQESTSTVTNEEFSLSPGFENEQSAGDLDTQSQSHNLSSGGPEGQSFTWEDFNLTPNLDTEGIIEIRIALT